MKPDTWNRVREIFEHAVALPEVERRAFVDSSCYGDDEIRREVQLLLAEDSAATGFLEPIDHAKLGTRIVPSMAGARVGRYELVRVIASGGMGTVYEAIQEEPRRTVALKMMRLGLQSPTALARFRFESEVLGRLHHPGIAQVFESGTHNDGVSDHAYFAMELVEDARSVVSFATGEKLRRRERIALFARICDAIHHGHQRGVIHRDLKPSNLLVDGSGQPKIIDFGVARATGNDGPTGFETQAGQIVGTLQYMSPEQVQGDPGEVDVRADVYALGTVLHELLTERRPYELEELSIEEAAWTVREATPKLPRELPLELQWILLRALAKEPERRYPSASELAADLRRYLNNEPVSAGAPSRTYRLTKFVRRHRVPVFSIAAIVLALAAGFVRAEVNARETRKALAIAELETEKAQGISSFFAKSLTSIAPSREGIDVLVVDVLDQAALDIEDKLADRPAAQALVRRTIGDSYRILGRLTEAEPLLAEVRDYVAQNLAPDDPFALQAMTSWGKVLNSLQRFPEAEEVCRETLILTEERYGADSRETIEIRGTLVGLLYTLGQLAEAEELVMHNLGLIQDFYGRSPELIPSMLTLAKIRRLQAEREQAHELVKDALELCEEFLPEDHYQVNAVRQQLAASSFRMSDWSEAEELNKKAIEWNDEHLDENSPERLVARGNLAIALKQQGQPEEAAAILEDLLVQSTELWGERSLATATNRSNLASVYLDLGRTEEGIEMYEELLALLDELVAEDHDLRLRCQFGLGSAHEDLDHWDEAEAIYRDGYEIATPSYGRESQLSTVYLMHIAYVVQQQGRFDEAIELTEELMRWIGPGVMLDWAKDTIDECVAERTE